LPNYKKEGGFNKPKSSGAKYKDLTTGQKQLEVCSKSGLENYPTLSSPSKITKAEKKAVLTKEFKYTKWEEYFRLQPRDYFGGRVLFNQ